MKYKFQMENGTIYDGYNEIEVKNFMAEIEGEMTPAMIMAIEAHGGLPVKEEKTKSRKGQKKVKPVKWENDSEVKDDSSSS